MATLKSERGQGIIELGLVFVLFSTMLFAIVEYSHLFYTRLNLRHSLQEAGRSMVIGGTTAATSRAEAAAAVFNEHLKGTGAHLQAFTLDPADGGGPGEAVTVRAQFNKPLFSKFIAATFPAIGNCAAGHVCFDLDVTWLNEPFALAPAP